jgi:2-polyprenyl-6-methoxyphenol hydroxylase-like FAD-dependent oxidoreductase
MRQMIEALPDAPPIAPSELVSPVLGKIDMTNVMRGPVAPGLALIGDAALATDPLWGVGCGWALQSAEWLSDAVAPALAGEESVAPALRRYRRTFRRRLAGHAFMIHDYAGGRKLQPPERLLFSAAARDPGLAAVLEAYGTRNLTPGRMVARAVPRALAVHAGLLGRGGRRASAASVERVA